jgi:hypothetical protein
MRRDELLALLEVLGREFERLGMIRHIENLRRYYLAVQHGQEQRTRDLRWSEEHTIEWLALFRVPPFHDRYRVRPRAYHCPCQLARAGASCEPSTDSRTALTFPGGEKRLCARCGDAWLVVDDAATG